MGKEWLYRLRGGGGGGDDGGSVSGRIFTKKGKMGGGSGGGGVHEKLRDTPSGCMNAVFQLFDFHQFQFQFPLHRQVPSFKPDSFLPAEEPISTTILKGAEAPRNSMEVEEPFMDAAASFPSTTKLLDQKESLSIPMGIQMIKTRGGCSRCTISSTSKNASTPRARVTEDASSECSSGSPGAKTPNLVARLMGLDLLPDNFSLSSSSSSTKSKSRLPPPIPQLPDRKQEFGRHDRQLVTQSRSSSDRRCYFEPADIMTSTGTRSLPETPRVSSARRSDVDHNRLSLHINKENVGVGEEFEFSGYAAAKSARRRELIRKEDQEMSTRSPGQYYARQIVKQVKESVSRRSVGADITNTINYRRDVQGRSDDHVVLLKAKKPSKEVISQSKESTPSSSPRFRSTLEVKNKPAVLLTASASPLAAANTKDHLPSSPKLSQSPLSIPSIDPHEHQKEQQQHGQNTTGQKYCKKVRGTDQRCGTGPPPRLKKPPKTSDVFRSKQQEPFVGSPAATNRAGLPEKKSKKTPLSSELLNISVVQTVLFPVNKDPSSQTTTKLLPQKQKQPQVSESLSSRRSTRLPRCSSQTYEQEATHTLKARATSGHCDSTVITTTTTGGVITEYQYYYIEGVLQRIGIDKDTPVSFTQWYSPAHPLDPSLFQNLEITFPKYCPGEKCNRRLIFQLVDEILVDILRPYMNLIKPWPVPLIPRHSHPMFGSELMELICWRIRSFPSADCRVLEDIDALIEQDLGRSKLERLMAFEEEGEAIVAELERELVESLVHETALLGMGMRR